MCITEDKLVESYGKASPRERFQLIYKNYSIFPQLVDCYETGLFNRILFEVEYNGKKKFVKYDEGAAMYSMGIHAFTELAKEAKAIYRIRRIVLVNTEIIDEYMENFRDI